MVVFDKAFIVFSFPFLVELASNLSAWSLVGEACDAVNSIQALKLSSVFDRSSSKNIRQPSWRFEFSKK